MKATLEFGTEELQKFAVDAGAKIVLKLFDGMGSIPTEIQQDLLRQFMRGMEIAFNQPAAQHGRRARRVEQGPFGGFGPGPFDPSPGPPGGIPGYQPGAGPMPPDNVQPIREPAHVDRCFAIESTRYIEAGIGCCACATYNGVQRTHCRNCGHKLCVIATPPPGDPLGDPRNEGTPA